MTGAVEVKVTGLAELGEALKSFSEKIGKRHLWRATYDAARVIEEEAIRRAPVRTGAMRDAIAIFRRREKDPSTAHYAIGVRKIRYKKAEKQVLRVLRGANQRAKVIGDAYYWRFNEFGTVRMPARPFLRPAYETRKDAALERFRESLAAGVEKATQESRR